MLKEPLREQFAVDLDNFAGYLGKSNCARQISTDSSDLASPVLTAVNLIVTI